MIFFEDLHVYDGKKTILHNLRGKIPKGKLCVVLGPNGAGKTTLLRSIAGLVSEANKQVFISNFSLASYSLQERSKLISWSAAGIDIPFAFKVYDILLMGRYPWHLGYPLPNDHLHVQRVLEEMNLVEFSKRFIGSLSSGEQKLVNIARAVVQDTPIIICDEPCAHLDLAVSFKVLDYLKLLSQKGKTIIISIHDMEKALSYGDYSVLMHKGGIISQGMYFPSEKTLQKVFEIQVKHFDLNGRRHMVFEPINLL